MTVSHNLKPKVWGRKFCRSCYSEIFLTTSILSRVELFCRFSLSISYNRFSVYQIQSSEFEYLVAAILALHGQFTKKSYLNSVQISANFQPFQNSIIRSQMFPASYFLHWLFNDAVCLKLALISWNPVTGFSSFAIHLRYAYPIETFVG